MKKIKLCAITCLCLVLLTGCKEEDINLKLKDITINTILIKNDGTIQEAVIEDFDKDYYDKEELSEYINKYISKYNEEAGIECVTSSGLMVDKKVASVIFGYNSIKDYKEFNEIEIEQMTAKEALSNSLIPNSFIDINTGDEISKQEALSNDDYNVIVLNQNLEVHIQGKIKYYSNAIVLNNSTVQTSEDNIAVIIYK